MAKSKVGGGPHSKNVVRKEVRTGSPRQQGHPGGVAQIGAHVGSHATNKGNTGYRGEPIFKGPANSVPLGNEVAAKTVCGPGGSRDIYKTGFQQTHGAVVVAGNPAPKGRDILGEYGPESKR